MTNRKVWVNIVIVISIAVLMSFPYLGTLPLFDPDEPVYAETAREMLQFNDFISPRIYGDFWYDKPPMYYWLVAGAFKIFGYGEFAARFPSAFLAVAGCFLLYLSGRKIFNERVGLLASLVLSSSLEYFYLSKAAVTDITLTFFLSGALLAFMKRNYYIFYACAALAVVTKGPVGLFFCGVIVAIYLLYTSNFSQLKQMKLVSGGALFLAIAAPWYLAMYYYHGMDFLETFLGFHNITRFLQPEHESGSIWYYYIPVLILGFFPWTAFLAQAFLKGLRARGQDRHHSIFLVIWASTIFLFFSISQTKLVSYILPMYPPLALLIGCYIDKAWSEKKFSVLKISAIVLIVLATILAAGLFYAGNRVTPELMLPLKIITGGFVVLVMLVLLFSYRKNFRTVIAINVIGMIFFANFLVSQLLPMAAPALATKDIVNEFKQHYDGQAPVYVAKFYRPGFMFYSGMPGIEFKSQDIESIVRDNAKAYFMIQKSIYQKLNPLIQSEFQIVVTCEDKIILIHQDK